MDRVPSLVEEGTVGCSELIQDYRFFGARIRPG